MTITEREIPFHLRNSSSNVRIALCSRTRVDCARLLHPFGRVMLPPDNMMNLYRGCRVTRSLVRTALMVM